MVQVTKTKMCGELKHTIISEKNNGNISRIGEFRLKVFWFRTLLLGRIYSGQELQSDQPARKNDHRFSGPSHLRRHGAGLRQERRQAGAQPHEDK